MRKLFIAVLMTASMATTAFAADVKSLNVRVRNSFQQEFAEATNVEWSARPTYFKATFQLDGKKIEAFYTPDGESLGKSTSIALDNLPSAAKRYLAKKYAGYTFKEAIQFDSPEETVYYVSAENEKQTVILKVDGGLVSVQSRNIKS